MTDTETPELCPTCEQERLLRPCVCSNSFHLPRTRQEEVDELVNASKRIRDSQVDLDPEISKLISENLHKLLWRDDE